MKQTNAKASKRGSIDYSRWGYFFIAPFFIMYVIFSLVPLFSTFFYSFFESYRIGLIEVGPKFVGVDNFINLFTESDILLYAKNTLLLWVFNFIPQITVSLLLAVWFTSYSLNLKGQQFFKTIIYMPNLIMASAFSMLFFTLFSDAGPVNHIIINADMVKDPIHFLARRDWTRILISIMNFLMWFGNTTILLMAGIMGIDPSLYEAARIDGANATKTFFKITIPLLLPIFVYVLITSLIGGIQLFDVPQILTNGMGTPDRSSMTLIMFLNKHLASYNNGMAGAVSVLVFIVTSILSVAVYKSMMSGYNSSSKKSKKGA